jgi:uncharacterized phiE125 gp8 family phage protein
MALNSNNLTTVATLKAHLGIPSAETSQDTRMELLINAASDSIERYLDRKIKSQTITEIQHGRRQDILILREWPVTSITELRVDMDHVFSDASTLIPSADYGIGDDKNSLVYYDTVFPRGNNNVKIVYVAGYATVPSDIEYAALLFCEWLYLFRNRQDIGRTSKSKGDESMSVSQGMPDIVRQMIEPYRRMEFAFSNAPIGNQ